MASEDKNTFAKVPGVLKVNEDTREEMLRRIYWKDTQYIQYGEGLAKYVDIKDRTVSPMTGGKSLLDYTHDRKSDYSSEISHKYNTFIEEAFDVKPYEQDLQKWEGSYPEIFTKANRLSEVGDIMYAQGMTFANYANSDRHVSEKYLTPYLTTFYGTSPIAEGEIHRFSIFQKGGLEEAYQTLSGEYKRATGRIPDIDTGIKADDSGLGIIHDYTTGEPNENNGGNYFLEQQLNYPDNAGRYTPSKRGEEGNRYSDEKMSENFSIPGVFRKYKSNPLNNTKYNEFDEGDVSTYDRGYDEEGESVAYASTLQNNENITVNTVIKGNNLLSKTNELFKTHKISTLMGRFHTSSEIEKKQTLTDSAVNGIYGNSHGRNLLKKNHGTGKDNTNGYNNPYCRVWTYHHQYDTMSKLIRPFVTDEFTPISIGDIQGINKDIRAHSPSSEKSDTLNGGDYLSQNTVLNKNGFVNVAPSTSGKVDIKKCMFSIENLAWKDVLKGEKMIYNLSREQQGPNGGRIMWFPPYDLEFQESVNVDWDSNDFIGRGEKVYTYKNTVRQGTLSFSLLIDHPGVIDAIKNKTANLDDAEDYQDILRFFAGCDTLHGWEDEIKEEEEPVEKDNNNDEGKQVPSEEKTKLIKFYVYFPNNYSGNKKSIDKNGWNVLGSSDEDWFYYLLLGSGTTLDPVWFNGYETTEYPLGNAVQGTEIYPNPYLTEDKGCTQWKLREEEDREKGPYNYRTDFDLRQVLENKGFNNYIDNKSYKLNSVVDSSVSVGATHSFAEIMCALLLEPMNKSSVYDVYQIINLCCPDKINEIETLSKELFSSKIRRITVKGAATKQDSKPRSGCSETNADMLAHRRAHSVLTILENMLLDKTEDGTEADYSDNEIIRVPYLANMADVNSKEAKSQRYAVVEIEYNPPKITKLSEAQNEENIGNSASISENKESITVLNGDNSTGVITEPSIITAEREKKEKPSPEKVTQMRKVNPPSERYETEADYFDKLEINDKFTYENLKKRFKYFTPAFHSISPEGFNARLTFLQQCTRQGHTVEVSGNRGNGLKTAGNLAFGRMPVCVLRIGDFLNTRMLINSLSINYSKDGMQWDLNPEGAGVQPMYATISMNVTILGGQSLTGPISRLQNAVTFNYYANTGVYDNRADRVTLDGVDEKYGVPKEKYTHLWTPQTDGATAYNTDSKEIK